MLSEGRRRGGGGGHRGSRPAGCDHDDAMGGDGEEEGWQGGLAELMGGLLQQAQLRKQQSLLRRAHANMGVAPEEDDEYGGATSGLGGLGVSSGGLARVHSLLEAERVAAVARRRHTHQGSVAVAPDYDEIGGEIGGTAEGDEAEATRGG